MRYFWLLLVGCLAFCSDEAESTPNEWPDKIKHLPEGLTVEHSADTVYASFNRKDPETKGKFQLKFSTTVSSMKGDVKIKEFGGYFWSDNKWKAVSMYDRPFNANEFDAWYGASDGMVESGKNYTDPNNWLMKGNQLTKDTIRALLYFIGTNEENQKVMGAKEIIGVNSFRKH
ncbi:MAG: hypothetical protein ACFHU9_05015 [Fluviicola sp.]